MKTVRHTFYYLLLRNFKNFAKDRKKIFFTFLSPLITTVFFGIIISTFIGNIYKEALTGFANGLNETAINANPLAPLVNITDNQIDTATNFFFITGILTVSSITNAVTLSAVIVEDRAKNLLTDFYISPTKPYLIKLSYGTINVCLNIVLCWMILFIGYVYMTAQGQINSELSVSFVKIFFTTMLTCMTSSLVFIFLFSFVKNTGIYTAISSLLGIFTGVFVGAYFPLSIMPFWLRQIAYFIPPTQISGVLKNFLFEPYFKDVFNLDIVNIDDSLKETLGIESLLFGHSVDKVYSIIYAASFTGLFLFLNIMVNPKIRSASNR